MTSPTSTAPQAMFSVGFQYPIVGEPKVGTYDLSNLYFHELSFIIEQLADFYVPLEARQWILSRQKLLGGEVPAEMIQANRVDDVLAAINQLRDGTYL